MLDRIARISEDHPLRDILGSLAAAAAALVIGLLLISGLSASGFNDPGSNAVLAQDAVVDATGASAVPSMVAIVNPGAPIASPEGQATVAQVVRTMDRDPGVARVAAPVPGTDALVSAGGDKASVLPFFRRSEEDEAKPRPC